ncbi:MAG: protein phosphatase 2C domain-containing protein [Streptosporangiaceae bacterium]
MTLDDAISDHDAMSSRGAMSSHGAMSGRAAWQVAAASFRGVAHQASGLPNQDAARRVAGGPGGAVIAAIADGHGHSRHFRSGSGSALATDIACQVAAGLAATLGQRAESPTGLTDAQVGAVTRADLIPAIAADWRAAVAVHLARQPYLAREQARLDAAGDGPEIPYGTTLVVAVITGQWLVCAQVGDGDMLAVRPDGHSFCPVPAEAKLDGERTRSLCQPDALAAFRVGVHDLDRDPLAAVLLATDGYGNSQTAEPWQPGVGQDLARFAAAHDFAWFERQVPGWAQRCASADGSGDDTTIALMLRS